MKDFHYTNAIVFRLFVVTICLSVVSLLETSHVQALGTSATSFVCGATTVTSNKWEYVAVTMSGTTVTHYLNGVPNGSSTISTTIGDGGDSLRIGSRADSSTMMDGKMDDVRIYNRAFSALEIKQSYKRGAK